MDINGNIKNKPIIFSTEMIRAILNGNKKQTRRVIKPQPIWDDGIWYWKNHYFSPEAFNIGNDKFIKEKCPYQIGQTLWVRETWSKIYIDWPPEENTEYEYEYKADIGNKYPGEWPEEYKDNEACGRWKPSIFMPREAARLFLNITNIKAEKIQDITEEDAKAEGVQPDKETGSYVDSFMCLWDRLNKKRGFGWDVNPWVWVIEFERINK